MEAHIFLLPYAVLNTEHTLNEKKTTCKGHEKPENTLQQDVLNKPQRQVLFSFLKTYVKSPNIYHTLLSCTWQSKNATLLYNWIMYIMCERGIKPAFSP